MRALPRCFLHVCVHPRLTACMRLQLVPLHRVSSCPGLCSLLPECPSRAGASSDSDCEVADTAPRREDKHVAAAPKILQRMMHAFPFPSKKKDDDCDTTVHGMPRESDVEVSASGASEEDARASGASTPKHKRVAMLSRFLTF